MKRVYMDNAATSYPKPPEVIRAVVDYMENNGCNINRGGYASAYTAAEIVLETRERLCELFGFYQPRNVIFTANITASINCILKGLLRSGDHVLVSAMEHNAVMRPLEQLKASGVSYDCIPCDESGLLCVDVIEPLIRPQTVAVVVSHASNVCGTIQPIEQAGEICRRNGLYFLVDSAQTAGAYHIDMKRCGIDALAFTAHKGLLAPQGLGGFLLIDALAQKLEPLIAGGTGSFSHLETMPEVLPDKFEAGTQNLPAIFGLHTALCYLERYGVGRIREREQELTQRFLRRLPHQADIYVTGMAEPQQRTAVVSLDFKGWDNAEAAFRLDNDYGIMTRCGLHCAPNAHKTLGTYPQGTVRFSFSHFNTVEEIDYAANAIDKILLQRQGH